MIAIDKLCYASRLRKKNGTVKFAYATVTLLILVISRSLPAAIIVLLLNGFLTVKKGGVKGRRYLHFMTLPLIFLVLSTLAILFHIREEPMDLFALPVGSRYLTGSREGLQYAMQLILTALASVSCLCFLSMTTPLPDILNVLHKLRCPRLLGELMLLIYRYIFVLMDTAGKIRIAQQSRLSNKDYRTAVKSFGALGSVLMIRAISRSKALYDAMEARCYDGTIQVLSEENPPEKKDIFRIILFECFLLIIAFGGAFL